MTGGESPRRRGIDFERRCKVLLEREGYWVLRTPGSRSAVDLIAIKPVWKNWKGSTGQGCQVLAVQCKIGGYLTPAERQALYDMRQWGMVPVMARRPRDSDGKQPRGKVFWAEQVSVNVTQQFLLDEAGAA